MDKEALKEFILKNSSDSRLYGLLYKEKQLLKQNDLKGFARFQIKKNRSMFLGSFSFLIVVALQLPAQFIDYIETGNTSFLYFFLGAFVLSCIVIFKATKEYYTIKSSMTLLLTILEDEQNTQEEASNSSAILSKA